MKRIKIFLALVIAVSGIQGTGLAAEHTPGDYTLPATISGEYNYEGIINNSGTCEVNSGASATVESCSSIILRQGFHAKPGSSFIARIFVFDSDNDGLPDEWEREKFGHLNYGANDDSDGDGTSNIVEYILETNPSSSSSTPAPGNYYQYDSLGRVKSIIRIQ